MKGSSQKLKLFTHNLYCDGLKDVFDDYDFVLNIFKDDDRKMILGDYTMNVLRNCPFRYYLENKMSLKNLHTKEIVTGKNCFKS